MSAIIAGLSVVTLENILGGRAHRREPDTALLGSLAKGLATAQLVYFAMKVTDLYARGVSVWQLDLQHLLFQLELFGTVAPPAALLAFVPAVRRSQSGSSGAPGSPRSG